MDLKLDFKYYLGDSNYLFIYRNSVVRSETILADLYINNRQTPIKTIVAKGGFDDINITHFDVINTFEVFVM